MPVVPLKTVPVLLKHLVTVSERTVTVACHPPGGRSRGRRRESEGGRKREGGREREREEKPPHTYIYNHTYLVRV